MVPWLLVVGFAALGVLGATGGFRVHRYSRGHVTAQLAIRGCGLYFSRTPDGTWWKARLRPRPRFCAWPSDWGEPPPDSGVREPRPPSGPGPLSTAASLEPPLWR